MNYMEYVAATFDVKLGERFNIEGDEADYWIGTDGLHWEEQNVHDTDDTVLVELLTGKKSIVKKPWRPIDGERFWYVALIGGEEACCESDIFDDLSTVDIMFLAFGNCFRTQQEAEEHSDEIIAKMREVLKG